MLNVDIQCERLGEASFRFRFRWYRGSKRLSKNDYSRKMYSDEVQVSSFVTFHQLSIVTDVVTCDELQVCSLVTCHNLPIVNDVVSIWCYANMFYIIL